MRGAIAAGALHEGTTGLGLETLHDCPPSISGWGGETPLIDPESSTSPDRVRMENLAEVTYVADGQGAMRPANNSGNSICPVRLPKFNDNTLDALVAVVICFNVILLGIELDFPSALLDHLEVFCLAIYILDIVLRLWWHGCRLYVADPAHMMDMFIVAASIVETFILPVLLPYLGKKKSGKHSIFRSVTMALRGVRLIRAFRLLRVVPFAKPVYQIVIAMLEAFARVIWVIVLIGMFLFTYAMVFTQLLGRNMLGVEGLEDPAVAAMKIKFNTLGGTVYELFRVLCGDVTDFGILISEGDHYIILIAYCSFQVFTCWLALAIFSAQVVDSTITTTQEEIRKEIAERAMEAKTQQRERLEQELDKILVSICHNDKIAFEDYCQFLSDERNAKKLEDMIGVSLTSAVNLWDAIDTDGGPVFKDDVIDGLLMAAHHDTSHSLMRIEAQIRNIDRHLRVAVPVEASEMGSHASIRKAAKAGLPSARGGASARGPGPSARGLVASPRIGASPRIRTGATPAPQALDAAPSLCASQEDIAAIRSEVAEVKTNTREIIEEISRQQSRTLSDNMAQCAGEAQKASEAQVAAESQSLRDFVAQRAIEAQKANEKIAETTYRELRELIALQRNTENMAQRTHREVSELASIHRASEDMAQRLRQELSEVISRQRSDRMQLAQSIATGVSDQTATLKSAMTHFSHEFALLKCGLVELREAAAMSRKHVDNSPGKQGTEAEPKLQGQLRTEQRSELDILMERFTSKTDVQREPLSPGSTKSPSAAVLDSRSTAAGPDAVGGARKNIFGELEFFRRDSNQSATTQAEHSINFRKDSSMDSITEGLCQQMDVLQRNFTSLADAHQQQLLEVRNDLAANTDGQKKVLEALLVAQAGKVERDVHPQVDALRPLQGELIAIRDQINALGASFRSAERPGGASSSTLNDSTIGKDNLTQMPGAASEDSEFQSLTRLEQQAQERACMISNIRASQSGQSRPSFARSEVGQQAQS